MAGGRLRFSDFAERDPAALALIDPKGRPWKRGALASLANKMARALRSAGLERGDSLAVIAPNCFEYLVAYLAATQIGLYFVPVSWRLAPREVLHIVRDCEARALLIHESFGSMFGGIVEEMEHPPRVRVAIGRIDGFISLEELTAGASDAPLADSVTGRMLAYTSATTGKPKGVVLSLDDAERALDLSIERRLPAGAPETHVQLFATALYHGAPLESAVSALHMGHSVVLTDSSDAEALLRLIEAHQVTFAYMPPSLFGRLLSADESVRSRYSLASLRRVVHAGAPCPVDVKHRMIAWLGPILWEAYGATEGAGTVVGPEEWLKYPGTVGRPMSGTRLKILDDDGNELPTGRIGTIYMTRYTGDRFHYRGDPEKTGACHRGDFFTVGDMGYVNDEGFLFICDRQIDMIIRSGTKVYPAEIENVLMLHPKVADCAVFGVPDEVCGEAIVAVVQLAPSATENRALRSELLFFIGEHLAPAKLPRALIFTPELPRDPTGKLPKRNLREQYFQPTQARRQ